MMITMILFKHDIEDDDNNDIIQTELNNVKN